MVEINRKTSGAHLYFFNLQPREVFCRNQAQSNVGQCFQPVSKLPGNARPQPASPHRPLAIHRTLNAEQPTLQWLVRIIAVRNRDSPSQSVSATENKERKKFILVRLRATLSKESE
jgi:hypothetical protein